jgi:ribosomal-protein-alanine N-acetyltransferase
VDELPQGVLRRWLDGLAPEADAEIPAVDRAKAAIPLRIAPRR